MRTSLLIPLVVASIFVGACAVSARANTLVPHDGIRRPLAGRNTYGTVAFRIEIPRGAALGGAAARQRLRPRYVSVSTKSFTIATDFLNPVVVDVDAGTGYASVSVRASVGAHDFTVTAYDRPAGQGNVLSFGTIGIVVPATGHASAYLTLDGVVASVVLALGHTSATIGFPALIDLDVTLRDADGNTILPGSQLAAGWVTLTSSDPANGKISQTTVSTPVDNLPQDGQRVRVAYSGAGTSKIVFSASGYGLTSVRPAILTPLPAPVGEQVLVIGGFDPNSAFSTGNGNQFLGTFGLTPEYRSGAVDGTARLVYVTQYTNFGIAPPPGVQVFRTDGAYALVDSFTPALFTPASMAIDSAAQAVYASDVASTNIFVFSTTSGHAILHVIRTGLSGGDGPVLAVDPIAKRLYVSVDGDSGGIATYNTVADTFLGSLARGAHGPIAIDPGAKRLYAVAYEQNYAYAYVDAYDTSGLSRLARIGPFAYGNFPRGLAVDAAGRRLYVLVPQGNLPPYDTIVQVYGLDAGLSFLGSFAATSAATDLAIAPGR